ncbi:MAG: hypothetical protein QXZ43_04450 [Candidatus Aenigmatarchaeota archaeon]
MSKVSVDSKAFEKFIELLEEAVKRGRELLEDEVEDEDEDEIDEEDEVEEDDEDEVEDEDEDEIDEEDEVEEDDEDDIKVKQKRRLKKAIKKSRRRK